MGDEKTGLMKRRGWWIDMVDELTVDEWSYYYGVEEMTVDELTVDEMT